MFIQVQVTAAAHATATSITHTLKVGSPYKAEVKILQTALGLTADGSLVQRPKLLLKLGRQKKV